MVLIGNLVSEHNISDDHLEKMKNKLGSLVVGQKEL
jgi:hypothetical protein